MPITERDLTDELDRQRRTRPDIVAEYRRVNIMGLNDVIAFEIRMPLRPGMEPRDGVVTIYSLRQRHPGLPFTFDEGHVYETLNMLHVRATDGFAREHQWHRGEPNRDAQPYEGPHLGFHRAASEHGKK